MHPLFDHINKYVVLPEKDFPDFLSHFTPKKIQRKRYLLQAGQVCKHMAFIIEGAMRKTYIDDKGIEHVVDLYVENWWAADRESFVMKTPSVFNIDAWEDCELLLITRENTLALSNSCPAFTEFLLKVDENNAISAQKRIASSISLTAEKRYANFLDSNPHFVQRFPQHIIASYLGITKDTLSRVRKKALRQ